MDTLVETKVMKKYEAMFILRTDLTESEKTNIFNQIKEVFEKLSAKINNANIWAEKRKLYFDLFIKGKPTKFKEGLYYLVNFESPPEEIKKISASFRMNENILRFLIIVKDKD